MLHKSISGAGERYNVIVIGSGLGGLTSANRLARSGHSVLLLEHHHQLGGLATWFKRKGHIFDVSLHGFPHGMVKTCHWYEEDAQKILELRDRGSCGAAKTYRL